MNSMKEQRSAGYLIAKIHQISGRIFTKKLKKYKIFDINPSQGRILFALWKEDGLSIVELGKKTALSKSTLTSMLDRLEESDHLKRVPSEDDRRKILIFLTEKNKKLQSKYIAVSREMTDLYYMGFSVEETDQFELYLQRLLNNLLQFE
ncbi:MAG: MarR family winged helix-turn-helix transcriptional regulator [Promethearchaeota archaeon]